MEPSRVWGDYQPHGHLSTTNIVNFLVFLFVLSPSIALTSALYSNCDQSTPESYETLAESCCSLALHQPVAYANVLFFVNVTVGFWLIGLAQRNFWLIDPYWTLLPPLLVFLYASNPLARITQPRSAVCLSLVCIWCCRLTHSYFRREEWKFGQREDWRYTKMAKENPKYWWFFSFFAVGLAQQPMLVGVSLPAYSVHFVQAEWNGVDTLACVVAVAGLLLAGVADNQLRVYMLENERRRNANPPEAKKMLLNTGIWRYSRHPNYLGETLWWLGFGLFAVRLGQWWMLCGWVINTATLITVTFMTENRMLKNWDGERAELYRKYRNETSAWFPWFPSAEQGGKGGEGKETLLK
jgi:steroid 5-alpha reductase family enzyme